MRRTLPARNLRPSGLGDFVLSGARSPGQARAASLRWMLLRSPSLILLLLPVGQLGCSNLLGLEELSFEEPVASQDPASSSGGAEASTGGANTGGASQATGGEPLVT
jgi:hypothetical protein